MKMMSKKEFLTVFKKTPRVTVDTVIKDRRGILLIKRSIKPDKGKWHFPGGTVLYKEKIFHAAKRKAREETGLEVKIKKFLGVFEYIRYKEPGYTHIINLVFLAEPIRGRLWGNARTAGKELKFFKKLPRNMIPEQRKILQGKLIR
ncbi:MAG: NUDIX domain-containing protein [Candidatus Aenigmarchaeota archaeon]|nr:NUDIX domain-containing protein [Candidatus Aenigmarchaeota archaeon]